jgi:hypothetical protein
MATNATSSETRIDGAVHDAVTSERGRTRENEQVVALRFRYTRGTQPVATTMVIDLPGAKALAAQLCRMLHDPARMKDDSVALGDECPRWASARRNQADRGLSSAGAGPRPIPGTAWRPSIRSTRRSLISRDDTGSVRSHIEPAARCNLRPLPGSGPRAAAEPTQPRP